MAATKKDIYLASLVPQATALFFLMTAACCPSFAGTLPKERADLLYHSYSGGDIEITGPSLLVRKNFKEKVSVFANYYVDQVSSASIDVVTSGASRYSEKRTEYSLGAEYIYDKATLSVNGTQSKENDYDAKTLSFDVSQEFFGDMTTLSLGYSHGDDLVSKNENLQNDQIPFEADLSRKRYRVGLNQVITQYWMMGLSAETVADQGFLNNPYRSVRYKTSETTAATQAERYPNTRNSDAIALRSIYYLPYRASIRAEYRNFSDSWGIKANKFELRYLHPYNKNWTFQANAHRYSQGQADFYSDLFDYVDFQTYLARDKEMSQYGSTSIGFGVFYEPQKPWLSAFDRTTINLQFDHMMFDYKNFRDARIKDLAPGEEPLYKFNANVVRFFISAFY
ncbi:MAG: DUF3570 domain-containing protein [Marinagarivorans sp.]|nr:DUF3570 domain-containing protein [Marinagarivorans sp.]